MKFIIKLLLLYAVLNDLDEITQVHVWGFQLLISSDAPGVMQCPNWSWSVRDNLFVI